MLSTDCIFRLAAYFNFLFYKKLNKTIFKCPQPKFYENNTKPEILSFNKPYTKRKMKGI